MLKAQREWTLSSRELLVSSCLLEIITFSMIIGGLWRSFMAHGTIVLFSDYRVLTMLTCSVSLRFLSDLVELSFHCWNTTASNNAMEVFIAVQLRGAWRRAN